MTRKEFSRLERGAKVRFSGSMDGTSDRVAKVTYIDKKYRNAEVELHSHGGREIRFATPSELSNYTRS